MKLDTKQSFDITDKRTRSSAEIDSWLDLLDPKAIGKIMETIDEDDGIFINSDIIQMMAGMMFALPELIPQIAFSQEIFEKCVKELTYYLTAPYWQVDPKLIMIRILYDLQQIYHVECSDLSVDNEWKDNLYNYFIAALACERNFVGIAAYDLVYLAARIQVLFPEANIGELFTEAEWQVISDDISNGTDYKYLIQNLASMRILSPTRFSHFDLKALGLSDVAAVMAKFSYDQYDGMVDFITIAGLLRIIHAKYITISSQGLSLIPAEEDVRLPDLNQLV